MNKFLHAGIELFKDDIKNIKLTLSLSKLVTVLVSSDSITKLKGIELTESFRSEDCAKNHFHELRKFKGWDN